MKLFSQAAERNAGPISKAISPLLPPAAKVLEIASGSGQHAAAFVRALDLASWQPSDPSPQALASIRAYCQDDESGRLLEPLVLDVHEPPSLGEPYDAVVNINMVHISPWSACEALMNLAAGALGDSGLLFMYGPYILEGEPLAPSNRAFDEDLRRRDPSWGLRELERIKEAAAAAGLCFEGIAAMPANNHCVWYRKS